MAQNAEKEKVDQDQVSGEAEIERGGRSWPLPEGARPVRPGGNDEDKVEEASNESFPASDPPAFTPSKIG